MRKSDFRVHVVDGRHAVQKRIDRFPERWHTLATFDDRAAAQAYLDEFLRDAGVD